MWKETRSECRQRQAKMTDGQTPSQPFTGGTPAAPDGDGGERFLVDVGQLVDDHGGRGEDPVRVEEGVEEVDGEEAQVGQALQQALHACVPDLRHLAGVERLAEADVNVVFVQPGIGPSETNAGSSIVV